MEIFADPSEKATALLHRLGVHEVSSGIWAFVDIDGKGSIIPTFQAST